MKNRSQGIGVRTRGKASVAVQNDRQGAVCQNSQCPADFVRKHKEALRMMLSGSARKPSEGSQETQRKPYTPAHRWYLCIRFVYTCTHVGIRRVAENGGGSPEITKEVSHTCAQHVCSDYKCVCVVRRVAECICDESGADKMQTLE